MSTQLNDSKVLVTGGAGFIGSHLVDALMTRGNEAVVLDDLSNGRLENISRWLSDPRFTFMKGDLLKLSDIKGAIKGCDAVFHLAAVSRVIWGQQDPLNCWRTNVLGTLNVLEACRQAQHKPVVFYGSSREVYGEARYVPVDEVHPKNPKSVYGMSKLCAEKVCYSYQSNFEQDIVILRFSNVYGSERDQLDRVIPKFVLKAICNEDIILHGGDQILDFTFIDDVINGILKVYDRRLDDNCNIVCEDFHFVTGKGVSVSDLAKMVVNLCDSSSKIIRVEGRSFDVRKFVGDLTKARMMLGHEPTLKLEDGLRILKERLSGIKKS